MCGCRQVFHATLLPATDAHLKARFSTSPVDCLFKLLGNFGLAILAVTVIIKIAFFPLANKSYASMAKMKAVQPQMMALRDR